MSLAHRFRSPAVACLLLSACAALCASGCNGTTSANHAAAPVAPLPSDEQLRIMLDDEINFVYTHRYLNLTDHAAWQIMHGVLPFGMRYRVYYGDQLVGAMQWVLDGREMKGWTPQHGTEDLDGRQGLKMLLDAGSNAGQGHPEQWLSIMAASKLPSSQKIIFQGRQYQIRDLLRQAMWDIYDGKEASWTLMSLIYYLGPEYITPHAPKSWTASDGQQWTIERIVGMEAKQDLSMSACGGTHRLTGLYKALKEFRKQNGAVELTGAWKAADKKVRDAISTARRFQEPDGTLSTDFFSRPGTATDPVPQIYSTGHTLEFLAQALPDKNPEHPDEVFDAPWVKRAAVRLCNLFHETRAVNLECGSLYHATSALLKYRERRFGPWHCPDDPTVSTTSGGHPTAAPEVSHDGAKPKTPGTAAAGKPGPGSGAGGTEAPGASRSEAQQRDGKVPVDAAPR